MSEILVAEREAAADIAGYLRRLLHFEAAAVVRVVADGGVLAVYGYPPFDVYSLRTARLAPGAPSARIDATVTAAALLTRLSPDPLPSPRPASEAAGARQDEEAHPPTAGTPAAAGAPHRTDTAGTGGSGDARHRPVSETAEDAGGRRGDEGSAPVGVCGVWHGSAAEGAGGAATGAAGARHRADAAGVGGSGAAVVELPSVVTGPAWAGLLPPRAGWARAADVAAAEVAERAAEAVAEFKSRTQDLDPAVRRAESDRIAANVWALPLDPALPDVPVRLAHAARALGFLGGGRDSGAVVAVHTHPRWIRLDAPFGTVIARRPTAAAPPPLLVARG